jgi:hypothetical protein
VPSFYQYKLFLRKSKRVYSTHILELVYQSYLPTHRGINGLDKVMTACFSRPILINGQRKIAISIGIDSLVAVKVAKRCSAAFDVFHFGTR